MADYANLMEWVVKKDGPVATIKFDVVEKPLSEFIEHHMSLGLALEQVRFDDTVRVVVITGRDDGMFELGPQRSLSARGAAGFMKRAIVPSLSIPIQPEWLPVIPTSVM